MRVLALSSAYGGAAVSIVQDGEALASGRLSQEHGLAAALPGLVASLMAEHGNAIDLVAVIVGPGSFTGVRAGVSLAHGVGLGYRAPVVGVTVAEAFAHEASLIAGVELSRRVLWTAVHARRDRVFIDAAGVLLGYATGSLPVSSGRIAVCGNAADTVAAALASRGADVMLTTLRMPRPVHVAAVATARAAGSLPALPALPLYVDLVEAKLPAAGLRPLPLGVAAP